ncbi:GNAT family N-acetyltransferase [Microbacterium terricola]|uniref:Acetyltransferase, GNAT n=1 Tax=Microbacterium terricola TaxID=344163 RepID=A0ABM8DW78_9MICO|nr:GNAT family N-acetyltransferase [Microbacterium terricola]UYK39520.1 GNAT family N-acetyltransferase [Microbacterium terricola]BDV29746.1 putative acetyltransferase, GNAT [Microbacterium terricola]
MSADIQIPPLPEHPDVALWRPATPDDIDALLSVISAADKVDHPTWTTPREDIADQFELSHIDPARDTLIGFAADGRAVAVGAAVTHPSRESRIQIHLEGTVHPDWRRRGIGAVLLDWEEARARQQYAEAATDLPGEIHMHVEEADAGAVVLAESRGLACERWFTSMERDSAVPAPEVDAGSVTIIAYTPQRSEAVREARNDAFRDHWGSLHANRERWSKFVDGPFLRPDLSMLALDGERVVAFCLASVNEDDWAALGASHAYIDLIGVVRDHRGLRRAPAVISASLRAIAAAGLERAVLDVDTASPTGANSLYEGLGFTATERSQVLVRHL